jgi:hypothetical protein
LITALARSRSPRRVALCVPEVVWHSPFACGANRLLLHPSSCMNSSTYARCNQRLLSPLNIHGKGSDRVGPHKSPLAVLQNFQNSLVSQSASGIAGPSYTNRRPWMLLAPFAGELTSGLTSVCGIASCVVCLHGVLISSTSLAPGRGPKSSGVRVCAKSSLQSCRGFHIRRTVTFITVL